VLCIVGIVKKSGRAAGVFGIVVFLLGCLMTFATLLDFVHSAAEPSGQRTRVNGTDRLD
jgi:hypothetical protein